MMALRRIAKLLSRTVAVLLLAALPSGYCSGEVASEYPLKAAFLVNFLKYVEWPKGAASGTVCLFGRDTLGSHLAAYEGRSIGGRELHIRRIISADQVADCQALFIPEIEEARYQKVLQWVGNLPVLTVSDGDGFTQHGGGIALVRTEGRLQFDINADALKRAGLRPNSQMMRLARQVMGASR